MYTRVGSAPRIFFLVLLILVLAFGGLIWFDVIGIIDVKDTLSPVTRFLGITSREPLDDADDPLLLERERLSMTAEAIEIREDELEQLERTLSEREQELEQRIAELDEREETITERENSFNRRLEEFDNRNANLMQVSRYLVGMPPGDAVAILGNMDDPAVIDLFRVTEEIARAEGEISLVAYWLSLMPPERAASLKRKMIVRPGE